MVSGILIAVLSDRQAGCEKRVKAASAELRQVHAELAVAEANLEDAKRVQVWIGASAKRVEGIVNERDALSWTPALRRIVATVGEGIELREVRAQRDSEELGTWTMRVGGVSSGAAPRAVADHYRATLERELTHTFGGTVTTRFEVLDDVAGTSPEAGGGSRGVFTIIATIDVSGAAGEKRKKGA